MRDEVPVRGRRAEVLVRGAQVQLSLGSRALSRLPPPPPQRACALREQIARARRAVEEMPDSAAAHLALAHAIAALHERTGAGRLDQAVAAVRKAAKLSPAACDPVLEDRIAQLRKLRP
jgi:hypothetical protein